MFTRSPRRLTQALFAVAVLGASCRLSQAALPDGFRPTAQAMPIKGWNGLPLTMTFGGFTLQNIGKGISDATRTTFWNDAKVHTTQRVSFDLADEAGKVWLVDGALALDKCGVDTSLPGEARPPINWTQTTQQHWHLSAPDGAPAWDLSTAENEDPMNRAWLGRLTSNAGSFSLQATTRIEGSPLPTADQTAVIFTLDGKTVAAVELMNGGTVFFTSELPAAMRAPVAGAVGCVLMSVTFKREQLHASF